jgi:hypothetical protein
MATVFVIGSHIGDVIIYSPGTQSWGPLDLWYGLLILGLPWSLAVKLLVPILQPVDAPMPASHLWANTIILSLGATTLLNVVLLWTWAIREKNRARKPTAA